MIESEIIKIDKTVESEIIDTDMAPCIEDFCTCDLMEWEPDEDGFLGCPHCQILAEADCDED